MRCGFGGPTPLGYFISQLQPGEQVIILQGEGYPRVEKETVDVIWQVAEFSALTAGGIRLNCRFNSDLTTTGVVLHKFEISEAAKQIDREVALARFEEGKLLSELDGTEPDWQEPGTFPSVPE